MRSIVIVLWKQNLCLSLTCGTGVATLALRRVGNNQRHLSGVKGGVLVAVTFIFYQMGINKWGLSRKIPWM